MSINLINISFSSLAKDFKIGLKYYGSLFTGGIRLKDILINQSYKTDIKSGRTPSKFNPDYWNGDYEFITMSDVDTLTFTLNEVSEEHITDEAIENNPTLCQAPENSLIVSNAMTLGLSFITNRPVYINQNVFCLDIDENKINKKFLLWYFNLVVRKILNHTYSSKYLSKRELSLINIPQIDISIQKAFEESIKPIEDEIISLSKKILKVPEIIDKVFGDYFNFNYERFTELKSIKSYNIDFSSFSSDVDLRFGAKFHRPAGEFVKKELSNITNKRIKYFLSMPIITGHGISPPDYDPNGDFFYVSMADIKNWKLNTEDLKYVSNDYAEKKKTKRPRGMKEYFPTTLEANDILMARSGEGTIGKVALIGEEETGGIFCDFIMRIKLQNYNPQFAYYYFRTSYFQYLIEIYKKGLGNNTNIFPSVVQEFPIPDISLEEQQLIVDTIYKEINKQNKIIEQIENKRKEIEKLLLNSIKE